MDECTRARERTAASSAEEKEVRADDIILDEHARGNLRNANSIVVGCCPCRERHHREEKKDAMWLETLSGYCLYEVCLVGLRGELTWAVEASVDGPTGMQELPDPPPCHL